MSLQDRCCVASGCVCLSALIVWGRQQRISQLSTSNALASLQISPWSNLYGMTAMCSAVLHMLCVSCRSVLGQILHTHISSDTHVTATQQTSKTTAWTEGDATSSRKWVPVPNTNAAYAEYSAMVAAGWRAVTIDNQGRVLTWCWGLPGQVGTLMLATNVVSVKRLQ